jgi:uncharacterized protein YjcR
MGVNMKPQTEAEIFNEMTKPELIAWIKENFFVRGPKMSWLLFHRWKIQSDALQKKEEAHLKREKPDFKKRDEYARQFNATKDNNERLRLLNLIKPYDDWLKKDMSEWGKLQKEQAEIDRLYDRIDEARKSEGG